jgi:anti-anti-sigma regulatory factor
MECRIEIVQRPDGCTLHLAGRLNAARVPELRSACAAATGHVLIDLTDLVSADAVGIDALHRLHREGVELTGVPRYLWRLLT